MDINQKFAKRLRKLRKEFDLTQAELADKASLDYKHLQKLEGRAPSSPTLETLWKLAKALGINVSKLTEDL